MFYYILKEILINIIFKLVYRFFKMFIIKLRDLLKIYEF